MASYLNLWFSYLGPKSQIFEKLTWSYAKSYTILAYMITIKNLSQISKHHFYVWLYDLSKRVIFRPDSKFSCLWYWKLCVRPTTGTFWCIIKPTIKNDVLKSDSKLLVQSYGPKFYTILSKTRSFSKMFDFDLSVVRTSKILLDNNKNIFTEIVYRKSPSV